MVCQFAQSSRSLVATLGKLDASPAPAWALYDPRDSSKGISLTFKCDLPSHELLKLLRII